MDKPISMIIKESKDTILETINKCNLHPSILELIVKDIYMDIVETAKKVSEIEEQKYATAQNIKETKK